MNIRNIFLMLSVLVGLCGSLAQASVCCENGARRLGYIIELRKIAAKHVVCHREGISVTGFENDLKTVDGIIKSLKKTEICLAPLTREERWSKNGETDELTKELAKLNKDKQMIQDAAVQAIPEFDSNGNLDFKKQDKYQKVLISINWQIKQKNQRLKELAEPKKHEKNFGGICFGGPFHLAKNLQGVLNEKGTGGVNSIKEFIRSEDLRWAKETFIPAVSQTQVDLDGDSDTSSFSDIEREMEEGQGGYFSKLLPCTIQ